MSRNLETALRSAAYWQGVKYVSKADWVPGKAEMAIPSEKIVIFINRRAVKETQEARAKGWKVARLTGNRIAKDAGKALKFALRMAK